MASKFQQKTFGNVEQAHKWLADYRYTYVCNGGFENRCEVWEAGNERVHLSLPGPSSVILTFPNRA